MSNFYCNFLQILKIELNRHFHHLCYCRSVNDACPHQHPFYGSHVASQFALEDIGAELALSHSLPFLKLAPIHSFRAHSLYPVFDLNRLQILIFK